MGGGVMEGRGCDGWEGCVMSGWGVMSVRV